MPPLSSVNLIDAIREHRLLRPAQMEELDKTLRGSFPNPRSLAKELIRRGWLTPYQANLLLQNRAAELSIGSYVLLQRLGEGGQGQVFKAKHRGLGRVCAIKLMPPERLAGADAAARFHQGVHAVSRLDHPNLVLAQDADEVGGVHLLVMEYVEGGIDLGRLVAERGAFPIEGACACIRQAALGLQHGVEHGLMHGGMKPSKLLLTRDRTTVKVLDVGLARVGPRGDQAASGKGPTDLDFLSPEQAGPPFTADARSDIYALGCTFYYLLSGRVPFAGGTPAQKRQMHLSREPEPIERLRPEVNTDVAGILKRMMAKRPEARYQTAAEVVQALAPLVRIPVGGEVLPKEWESVADQNLWESIDFNTDGSGSSISRHSSPKPTPRRNDLRLLLLLSVGTLGVLLALGVLITLLVWLKSVTGGRPSEGGGSVAASRAVPVLEFDGEDDFVTLPDNIIRQSGVLTVEAWFKTERKAGVILGYQNRPWPEGANEFVPALYIGNDGKLYAAFWDGEGKPISTPNSVADNRWHHLAFVATDKSQTLYLDGAEAARRDSKPLNHMSMSYDQIGGGHTGDWLNNGGGAFAGNLRDVRIWHAARTAADIKRDMDRRLTGNENGLVAYYPLDEAGGEKAADLTKNHRSAKLGNGYRRFMPKIVKDDSEEKPPPHEGSGS